MKPSNQIYMALHKNEESKDNVTDFF
jgi:hypothetical protein